MRKLLKTLAATVVCLSAAYAYGEDPYEEIDGIKWYYSVSNEEASVTEIWSSRDGNSPSGDLVVPDSLGGAPVTRIERYVICPYGNSGLTSVTFPDSLRTMDEGNFMRCGTLTNVVFGTGLASFDSSFSECWNIGAFVVPEGNPNFSAEGPVLYSKDKKTLVKCCAQFDEFDVPASVEVIGPNAFAEMKSLASVTFPSGLREIQDRAFYNCNNLASVLLPPGLQVIGSSAFSECHAITSMAIPASVAKIGESAFARNISLVSLTITEGVKDVGPFAFNNCDALAAVTIPNSVTNIGGGAFEYCTNLWDVTIGSGVVKIGDGLGDPWVDEWGYENRDSAQPAFGGCDSLMNFKLASGNKVFDEIGGCLFLKNTPKTAKTLAVYPNGREDLYFTGDVNVTKIGEGACAQCNKFTTIDITNSVRDVAAQSFMSCWYLGKVVVNPGVTNIDYGAFMLNMQLADVEIAGTVKTIGEQAFMHCYMPDDEVIGRLVLHEGIEEIGPMAFEMTRDLVEVVIPDSVTKIGYGAFSNVIRLKRLTVGSGVAELPPYFCSSEELKTVTIRGENLKRLGEGAFAYCRGLETINLPASVEFIGEYAFDQCEKLPYISLSASEIGPNAFEYCEKLARVDFSNDLRVIGTNAFLRCYALNNVVIPESVETIEPGAFERCTNLGTVYLPKKFEGVINVSSVFAGCPLGGEGIVYYGPEGVAYVTVTFMSQGKPVETRKYLANTLDYLPAITADGLAFVGWYNAEEGGTPASDADLSGDVTFYARWVESPFINTGVQEWNPAEDEAFPGAIVWRTGDLTGGEEASASYAVVGPAVVNFQWKQTSDNSEDHLIVYVDGEETGFTQSEDWTKATVQVPESGSHVVTWTYSRHRWSSDPETACAELADIRVTAGTAKTITFDVNGGTLDEDWETTRKVVTILGDLPFADKDGVAFAGWWTERDGGERVTAATKPEGDATYYAHWVELPFKVSGSGKFWLAEDGSWATLRYYEGRDMTASVTIKGPCVVSFDWRHDASRYFTSHFKVDGDSKKWRDKDDGWKTVTWTIEDTDEHEIEWAFSWGYSYEPGQLLLKNISMGTPYEIAFDPGDNAAIFGDDVDRQELGIGYCMRGGTLGHLPAATSDGYMAFDGWYTAAEGGEKVTSETPVTGPATYYAHWVESPVMTYWLRSWLFEPDGSLVSDDDCNEYNSSVAEKHLEGPGTLTFRWRMQSDSGNGYFAFLVNDPTITDYVETNRLTKSSGEWITERYVFTNENYTWVRWAYGVEGSRGGNEHGWIKDVKWVSNVVDAVEWTVTFNANGGELKGDAEKIVTDNFPVGRAPVATKTDYSFVGWFTEAEGGEEVTEEMPVTTNMTVFAHWAYIEPPPEPVAVWTVTFEANGGVLDGDATKSVTNGCAVGELPTVTKDDYTFDGWFTAAEGGEAVTPETAVTGDATYYAHWTASAPPQPVDPDGIAINTESSYTTESDGTFTLVLPIVSATTPKVTVKGLPSGITFTASTLTIAGKAKAPGVATVTVSATNAKVKTPVTATFELKVPNFTTDTFKAAGLDTDGKYVLGAGAAPDLSGVIQDIKDGGWKLAAAGLPAGLKYDDKNSAITGVATKEGVFTVTFTATQGKTKEVATATFEVVFPTLAIEIAAYGEDASATNKAKVVGGGKYPVGAKVTLKATPDKGKVFAGWFDAEGKPLAGSADYRTASYAYVATDVDVALTAKFATAEEDIASLKVTLSDAKTDDDGTYELDLGACVESASLPKLAVKGLPTGLKFDTKTLKIAGKATKPGVYVVKVEATNTSVKKATDASTGEFELKVPNFTTGTFKDAGLDTDGKYVLAAGVLPDDITNVVNAVVAGGWTLKIDGLPAGVKYDAKKNVFSGVATKEGFFTVTFTATQGKTKEVATATFEVAYPTLTLEIAAYGEDASATNKAKVVGGGKYPVGAKVTLKATPDKGKVFAGWFDAEGNPLAGAADYRTASYAYVATDADVTLTAKFATEAEDIASLKVTVTDDKTDDDGAYELDLGACVASASLPKLAVKGLPTGLKFDTKTLKIAGKATKPGVYAVKVEATNTSVKKATAASTGEFKLTVPNFTCAALPKLKAETDAYGTNFAGVAFDPALVDCTPADGWAVKVAGLPAGLKYDAKTGKITGVSTAKPGSYTVTFTATKGKEKQEATITLNVEALPDWAVGTFDGPADGGGIVQALTIAANGKISGKVLEGGNTWALSAVSFDSYDAGIGAYLATVVGKNGKLLATNFVAVTEGADGTGVASCDEWTAYQNLWKRADTKGGMPVFKASFDSPVELGTEVDLDNTVKLTFKKDGVVSFAGKVGGAKVSGSSQLVNDGTGWSVTLYAPPKGTFAGWSKTFDVTLTTDEKNVVTDVTVETASAVAPLWAVGEYVGYGNVYKPNKTGLDEYLYGMLYVDVAEDLTFTGRFDPVDGPPACYFSGKFTPFGGGGAPGYQAEGVTITVRGVQMPIGFSLIYKPYGDKEQGYGDIFGWSNYVLEDEVRFFPTRAWQNVWNQENLAEERPTFAEGTVLTIEPGYEAGDSLNFAFSTDGKSVAVTGQVDGGAVNTTATIGVESQGEGKCECYLYFMTDGHVYSLSFTIPSSGVVTKDDIILDGDLDDYFGMVNAW